MFVLIFVLTQEEQKKEKEILKEKKENISQYLETHSFTERINDVHLQLGYNFYCTFFLHKRFRIQLHLITPLCILCPEEDEGSLITVDIEIWIKYTFVF